MVTVLVLDEVEVEVEVLVEVLVLVLVDVLVEVEVEVDDDVDVLVLLVSSHVPHKIGHACCTAAAANPVPCVQTKGSVPQLGCGSSWPLQ